MSRDIAAALAAEPFAVPVSDASRRHLTNESNEDAIKRTREKIEPFLEGFEILHNCILLVQYRRPDKTAGGIIRTENHKAEDIYQGKAGLVVKIGINAFVDRDGATFNGQGIAINDWAVFVPSSGKQLTVAGVECRVLTDTAIFGKIARPDLVW